MWVFGVRLLRAVLQLKKKLRAVMCGQIPPPRGGWKLHALSIFKRHYFTNLNTSWTNSVISSVWNLRWLFKCNRKFQLWNWTLHWALLEFKTSLCASSTRRIRPGTRHTFRRGWPTANRRRQPRAQQRLSLPCAIFRAHDKYFRRVFIKVHGDKK